jgi:OOP family OmpA-OmpF porin
MNNSLHLLTIFLLIIATSVARADVGDWYVAPALVYTDDDGSRLLDDSVAGGQVSVGREMSEHFWLEGLIGYSDIKGFPGQEHFELGLNVVGNLMPDKAFSPYLIGGLGYLGTETSTGSEENRPSATLGLGFNWRFGESQWSLRGDYRWRLAWEKNYNLTDRIGSLGVQYSFGRDSMAMSTPEPQRAPEPQPVPPPVVESDSDGDGVLDSRDDCPRTPADIAVNSAGCPADSDLDGVTDDRDRCPGSVAGVAVDINGCEIREVIELQGVYFTNDSDVLIQGSESVIAEAAATLIKNPDIRVEVAGHTDSRGQADDNMNLSLRRAFTVRTYLVQAGVNPDNLTVRGYGESSPKASNTTEAGQADNRRVELRVLNPR